MNVKQVAEITGVTVRTLHHYEQVGLLVPSRNSNNEYRQYSNQDLDKLQQILFFKECGFSLGKIKEILDKPNFDNAQAFELQKKYLLHEKSRIDSMLIAIEKSIQNMKGEIQMSQKEKFSGFDFGKNPYEEEARKLWGDEAVDKSKKSLEAMDKNEQNALSKRMDEIYTALAGLMNESIDSDSVQHEVGNLYNFFNSMSSYSYTLEAFAGVGQMYVEDERFTETIDKYGGGLSKFLAEAMKYYSQNKK